MVLSSLFQVLHAPLVPRGRVPAQGGRAGVRTRNRGGLSEAPGQGAEGADGIGWTRLCARQEGKGHAGHAVESYKRLPANLTQEEEKVKTKSRFVRVLSRTLHKAVTKNIRIFEIYVRGTVVFLFPSRFGRRCIRLGKSLLKERVFWRVYV